MILVSPISVENSDNKFGPFVVTAPSIMTIPKQFFSPVGGGPITVVVTGSGDFVSALDLPGKGELLISNSNQSLSWECKDTGIVSLTETSDYPPLIETISY